MLYPKPKLPAPRRVVITGAGLITPLGRGWRANAQGFRIGARAIGPVTLFDVSKHRSRIAAEIREALAIEEPSLPKRRLARMERAARMLLIAGREAWQQAAWTPGIRAPLVLGTTSGGMTLGQDFFTQLASRATRRKQAERIAYYQPQRQGADLQETLDCPGPITTIANACATGANVVGHAFELIRGGHADRAIAAAYDAISHLVYTGFDSLQALSPGPCRPFHACRDGLTMGEGAAVLNLETFDSAKARGAQILGEVVGYGAATDTHHLTQPHPDGHAALRAMERACEQAGVRPDQIGYVNAHGTATPHNDRSEASALNRWAGDSRQHLHVSSTKASIGHSLGAAGAIEAVVCLMSLREGWLPPNPDIDEIDPVAEFAIVREPVQRPIEYALSNSFGFGGANASLILRRVD